VRNVTNEVTVRIRFQRSSFPPFTQATLPELNFRVMTTATNLRREALAGGRVKGAMVRAHLQFVRDQLGEPALALALKALPAAAAAEVQGILATTWCTFESLIVLDRAIARAAGREERELLRELGRYSARINLSTIYRAFHRDDIHDFFRNSTMLHRKFQDFGDCEYEQVAKTHGRISIRNSSCYSPAYCTSEAGYLEQVIETHGGTAASVTESSCQSAGDDRCAFELRWH
jgi:predicted hydrocarbon binding protein